MSEAASPESARAEEVFRGMLDARGVLRPEALPPPERSAGYAIFAQRKDASLEIATLKAHATRFFDAKLGLTVEKRYDEAPRIDAARVVLAQVDPTAGGTRLVYGRPTEDADVAAAEAAEAKQGTSGMALLAQRCGAIWVVVTEAQDDRVALTIAAIFASVFLGPIVCADEIFGVRTARLKLEGRARPYR